MATATATDRDSLVTLLETAGCNVDLPIVEGWDEEECEVAERWANIVIDAANAIEEAGEGDAESLDGVEIPGCVRGYLPTALQSGTSACVLALVDERRSEDANAALDVTETPAATAERLAQSPGDAPSMEPKTLLVKYGKLSIGSETCRISCKIATAALGTQTAREWFVNRRLTVTLRTGTDQQEFEWTSDGHGQVHGSADTKKLSIGTGEYGTGLTFNRNDIDLEALLKFVEREGRLTIREVADIPEPEKKRGKKAKAAEDAAASPAEPGAPDEGAAMDVTQLGLPKGLTEKLIEAECATVGALEWFIATDEWWHRKIKGVGESKVDRITQAIVDFRQRHPVPVAAEEAVAEDASEEE